MCKKDDCRCCIAGLTADERSSIFTLLRHVIYFVLMTLSILGMWEIGKIYGADCVAEDGIIEDIETILLLVSGLIFLAEAALTHRYRALAFWLAALCFAATCRELDFFFDHNLPVISWKFCYIFPLAAIAYAATHREGLRESFFTFIRSNTFYLLLCAVLVIVIIAQAVAHRSFLADVLGNGIDMSLTRRVIEEPMELVGYILIFFSTYDFYAELISKEKK